MIIIEDADRLTERAADALLKALEEPPPRTVWILCAPSLEDVIITIRSRSRHVRLRTPPVEAVAELLVRRDGVDPAMALYAARAAQSHVGLARRLARDEGARIRRRDVIALAGQIRGVGDAVDAAADLAAIADEESVGVLDRARRRRAGPAAGDPRRRPAARTQPPHIRSQVAALEREQKTRATRFARDVVDRSLVDLLSVYRDALVLHTGASVDLVNQDMADHVQRAGRRARARAAAAGDGRHRHGPRADRRQRRRRCWRSRRWPSRCSCPADERARRRRRWTTSARSPSGFRDTVGGGRRGRGAHVAVGGLRCPAWEPAARGLGALAALAAARRVVLAVSGCSSIGSAATRPRRPRTRRPRPPPGSRPAARRSLARFYDQKLRWSKCQGFQCAG